MCHKKNPARVLSLQEAIGGKPGHPAEGEEELGSIHYHKRAAGDLDDQMIHHLECGDVTTSGVDNS